MKSLLTNKRNLVYALLSSLLFTQFAMPTALAATNSPTSQTAEVPPAIDFNGGDAQGYEINLTARVEGGTLPECNKSTGGGKITLYSSSTGKYGPTIDNYYVTGFPGCKKAKYTRVVIKCVIAEDIFRFYGTEADPFQSSSLTRVYNLSHCSNDQIGVRDFLPNPLDAGATLSGDPTQFDIPTGTLNNPSESYKYKATINNYGEPYFISDNCTNTTISILNATKLVKANGASVYGANTDCFVGGGLPRVKSGVSCENLQTSGENSIANAIKGNDSTAQTIRDAVFANYSSLMKATGATNPKIKTIATRFPAAYAAAMSNLPYNITNSNTTGSYTSADKITSMDNTPCSSIFDFIPVLPKKDASAVQMATCVVPVYLPARVFEDANGTSTFAFWDSFSKNIEYANVPRYLDIPLNMPNGNIKYSNTFSETLNSATAKSIYADNDSPKSINEKIPNSLVDLIYKDKGAYVSLSFKKPDLVKKVTGGYFFPSNKTDSTVPYLVDPSSNTLKFNKSLAQGKGFDIDNLLSSSGKKASSETKLKYNVASSALSAASCIGIKLKNLPLVDPTSSPSETPTTSKTRIETPPPTKSPTPSPTPTNTKSAVDESIANPGGDNNAPCSGPVCVRVTLQAPATFTVGGTSRIQTVKATKVQLLCNGHTCDPSSSWDNSDPVISTPIGQLSVVGTGGFTACSSSLQKDCDLAIKSSTQPSSPITSASVSLGFYSPTRTSEAAKVTLPAASVTITNKKLVCVVSHVVSYGPSFDDKGVMTSPGGSYTVCDREGWVPDSSTTHSLGSFELVFPAGQSASKPVSGTIGK